MTKHLGKYYHTTIMFFLIKLEKIAAEEEIS